MNKDAINEQARGVLAEIWSQRKYLWPQGAPEPIKMLEPEMAAKVLGIEYVRHEELSGVGANSIPYAIAGLVDRQARKIAISSRFPEQVMRFTGAHEVGHFVLHPHARVMHRDPPINGLGIERANRDSIEKEADHFAACLLMPKRLVVQRFEETFGINSPLKINDETAFLLHPNNPACLMRAEARSLACELAVASAISYGSRSNFCSMADQFGVSVKSMAIRLQELGLVEV